jgi:hypothetical protein
MWVAARATTCSVLVIVAELQTLLRVHAEFVARIVTVCGPGLIGLVVMLNASDGPIQAPSSGVASRQDPLLSIWYCTPVIVLMLTELREGEAQGVSPA